MLISYLKIALRSLLKNKVYSVITVSGLAIGLTGFTLIGIYVRKETSFDKAFAKASSIYRINTKVDVNGIQNTYSGAHYPAAYDMKEEYPEVIHALTLYDPIPFQGDSCSPTPRSSPSLIFLWPTVIPGQHFGK